MKKFRTAALAGLGMLALAGCSSAEPSPAPAETVAPTLSVPETTADDAVDVRINPAGLSAGDMVRVSAFGGDFAAQDLTCDQEVAGVDLQVNGSGQEQGATVPLPGAGTYQITMSAPGYSSDCHSDNARTTAKTTPEIHLDGNLNADGDTTYKREQGKPFDVSVILSNGVPEVRPLPVELHVLGPYSTEPELRAAQCDPAKVISSKTLQWEGRGKTGSRNAYDTTQLTIDDVKGLYLVTAKVAETDQNFAAETACDNYQSVMKVALETK